MARISGELSARQREHLRQRDGGPGGRLHSGRREREHRERRQAGVGAIQRSTDIDAGDDGGPGSINLKSDNDEVYIYDYGLYNYGQGDITITAGGNVVIKDEYSTYEAYYGNVNITGGGTVYLYEDYIYAGDESSSRIQREHQIHRQHG